MNPRFPAFLFLVGTLFRCACLADDGAPHNGPHNVPGVIRAVDFNDGASLVAYYAATPGNQGGDSSYRPDTDVDIAQGPGGPYVISSRADGPITDWLKYTIEVSQAGWYTVDYFARTIAPGSPRNLVTLVDDRPLGDTYLPVPLQEDFADVARQPLRLGAGRHTLGVLLPGSLVALDRIEIRTFSGMPALTPRIVSATNPEVIVADAVVTDAPFQADPTGMTDSTGAFNDAIATVATLGGGTVFVPAGKYRIDQTLYLPTNTTLRGADSRDRRDPRQIETLLLASFGEGDATARSFISLGTMSCVRDLSIWYPSQGFRSETVRPYPATVSFDDAGANALNLRLYNSYEGIAVRFGSAHVVADIVGTVLHQGLTADEGFEFSYLHNVDFSNETWKSAPREVITNAPATDLDRAALDVYTRLNVVGVRIGVNAGYDVYGVKVRDTREDLLIKKLPADPWGFYGVLSKIDGLIEEVDGYGGVDLHFVDTDRVREASALSYDFASMRSAPNRSGFVSVLGPPYGALGDGIADDTSAIQKAIDDMGLAGGGTVYLPQGQYRVTRLTVAAGVELRGPLGGGSHDFTSTSACAILAEGGRNTAAPDSDPALLTLSAGSGIRGFDIVYREQGYGSAAAPVLPYPFTIRGAGAGIWVENVSVANAYNLLDLASHRCDDHLVSGVVATAFHTGVLVGGGSQGGRLEKIIVSWGPDAITGRLSGPLFYGQDAVAAYVRQNSVPFAFGNCAHETAFGLDSFDVKIGMRMLADGGGCRDSEFWQSNSDTSSQAGFLFEGGDDLRFIGLEVSTDGTSFVSAPSFAGSVDVYGVTTWGNSRSRDLSGGAFRFYNEGSLTLGKTATASSSASEEEHPSNAVDGSEFTKWTSATGGTNWLMVDLGQPSEIDRWVVRHAGINGEPDALNTNVFAFQVSDDGQAFSDADQIPGNAGLLTDRPIAARGRFVRLLVTEGTAPGGDGRARIYEFEAHGKEGWQFTNDAEGWSPSTDISSFAVSNGKLEVSSSGSHPIVASPDNLDIPTSRFYTVRVRMRNAGAPTPAKLAFATREDPSFSDAKSVSVPAVSSSPDYVDYEFDFSGLAAWTGNLKQLRLTPLQSAGDVSIDAITLEDAGRHRHAPTLSRSAPRTPRLVPR